MLLWSGQLVSWTGTEVSGIALPLIVLSLTGSPAQAGGVAAIRGLVYVFWAIPAGVLIDRWERKLVMVLANLGSGLAMGSIALALALHHLSVVQLYIASALEGSCFVFANLGRFASFPKVVSQEQFPAASAQSGTATHIALLIGPPLGGFLYQLTGGILALEQKQEQSVNQSITKLRKQSFGFGINPSYVFSILLQQEELFCLLVCI